MIAGLLAPDGEGGRVLRVDDREFKVHANDKARIIAVSPTIVGAALRSAADVRVWGARRDDRVTAYRIEFFAGAWREPPKPTAPKPPTVTHRPGIDPPPFVRHEPATANGKGFTRTITRSFSLSSEFGPIPGPTRVIRRSRGYRDRYDNRYGDDRDRYRDDRDRSRYYRDDRDRDRRR